MRLLRRRGRRNRPRFLFDIRIRTGKTIPAKRAAPIRSPPPPPIRPEFAAPASAQNRRVTCLLFTGRRVCLRRCRRWSKRADDDDGGGGHVDVCLAPASDPPLPTRAVVGRVENGIRAAAGREARNARRGRPSRYPAVPRGRPSKRSRVSRHDR